MTDRERLIRLMQEASQNKSDYAGNIGLGQIADYLLEHGVIILPCKVGDTVYELEENGRIAKGTVQSIHQNLVGNEQGRWIVTSWFDYYADSKKAGFECSSTFDDFGKTVFLTREEAEKKR